MKASELRIGNFIEFSNGITPAGVVEIGRRFFTATSQDRDGDFELSLYHRPIVINEYWLQRFGFEKIDNKLWVLNPIFEIEIKALFSQGQIKIFFYTRFIDSSPAFIHFHVPIAHVHKLQNAYHTLTDLELPLRQIPPREQIEQAHSKQEIADWRVDCWDTSQPNS